MEKYREMLGQVLRLAVIVAVCVAVMLGIYALMGLFSRKVLIGGLLGGGIAIAHFVFLSITVSRAIDRASEKNNVSGLQLAIQASAGIRLLILAVVLILLFKAQICDPVATLIPLLVAQVALKFIDLFQPGKGDDTT